MVETTRELRSIICLVAMSASVMLTSCSRDPETAGDQVEAAQRPDLQESWGVELQVSEMGIARMHLEAWHMERYDDPDSLFAFFERNPDVDGDRVQAIFYDSLGDQSATLTAESVRFDDENEQLIATGDVRVVGQTGRILQCELLNWDQVERSISAPGFVYLQTEDEKIRGFDLVGDENLDNYVIRRITGTVVVREDEE